MTHRSMIESAVNYVLGCDLRHEDIGLIVTPLFWGAPPIVIVMPQLYVGGTLIITDDFSPETVLGLIQGEKVSTSIMTPPMIMALLEHPQLSSYDTSSLRHVWFGGVPMPVESLKRAIKTVGNVFFQVYGMIELTPMAITVPKEQVIEGPPEKVKRLASCGREPANVETRVVNDDGKDVAEWK